MELVLPKGLVMFRLEADARPELLQRVRSFCLRMIEMVYGYGYREDWHADLDGLLKPATSAYFAQARGAFFVVQNSAGEVIGTAGMRALTTRPDIIARAGGRYAAPEKVASNWRMYVDPRYRKLGLGALLIETRRAVAAQMGYETLYFHCSKDALPLRRFWEKNGFVGFMEDEMSAHYDGPLVVVKMPGAEGDGLEEPKIERFWKNLEAFTAHLKDWGEGHEHVPDHLCHQCQNLCLLLKDQHAQLVCSDPRNAGRVRAVREAYADTWSSIYSRLEFKVAEELWPQVATYDDFRAVTDAHPLFLNADDVALAEMKLLAGHGVDVRGLKVCMIGPGAMPNTALAFANAGAEMTVVDCFAPACAWVKKWFGKVMPGRAVTVLECFAEEVDYTGFDVVIVAAMLYNRASVIKALEAAGPRHVLLRSTANRRPMSMLMPQSNEDDLRHLSRAVYVGETNPPLQVGNFSLLYRYPQARV